MTSLLKENPQQTLKGFPLEAADSPFRRYVGSAHPFGATVSQEGVNFALFSANATAVSLLLFANPDDEEPTHVKCKVFEKRKI